MPLDPVRVDLKISYIQLTNPQEIVQYKLKYIVYQAVQRLLWALR